MVGIRALAASAGIGVVTALCAAVPAVADSGAPEKPSVQQSSRQSAPQSARSVQRPDRRPASDTVKTASRTAAAALRPRATAVQRGEPVQSGGSASAAAATAPRSVAASTAAASPAAPAAPSPLAGLFAAVFNQTPTVQSSQTGQSGRVVTGRIIATDPDSEVLSYTVTRAPSQGTVAIAADGTYTYTAAVTAAAGTVDSFDVQVSDASSGFHIHGLLGLLNLLTFGLLGAAGHVATATVPVSMASANRAPTGTAGISGTDPYTGIVTGRVFGSDPDGDPLNYSGTATTSKGSVVVSAGGTFTYSPSDSARSAAGAPGAAPADQRDGFTVTITDGRGGTAEVAVSVPVVGPFDPSARLTAFPGAECFGAYATGGRGGSVIYVTNLNPDGPGSLQWAIDQPGAKYILFKVSGLIDTQIHLTNGDVTIAGQTSPGGITVRGFVTDETPFQDQAVQPPADYAQNWILQDIRLRPGLTGPSDDGLRIRYTRNAIVDHVSIGNATDEAIEISFSHDITVQNTVIAETVGGHSFYGGVLMNYSNPANGFGLDNISLHHNVFNRIEGRLPEGSRESLAAANSTMNLELSNNLYWDPRFFVALAPDTGVVTNPSGDPYPIYWRINAVNNYFRTTGGFPYGMFDDQIMRNPLNRLYVSGNQMSGYPTLSDYQLFYCCNDFASLTADDRAALVAAQLAQKLPSRLPFPLITYTSTAALGTTLLNSAGAWPRDPMDLRLMGFVATNTTSPAPTDTNPAGDALLPAYVGAPPAPPADTDNDGMPDTWEISKGLNPKVANTNATGLSPAGYTDLEVYLQELMASRVTGWP